MSRQLKEKIHTLEQQLKLAKDELSNQEKVISKEEQNKRDIATLLHDELCGYNHTDGCGWFYDKGDWTEYSRKEYLKKAERVIEEGFSYDDVYRFIKII